MTTLTQCLYPNSRKSCSQLDNNSLGVLRFCRPNTLKIDRDLLDVQCDRAFDNNVAIHMVEGVPDESGYQS